MSTEINLSKYELTSAGCALTAQMMGSLSGPMGIWSASRMLAYLPARGSALYVYHSRYNLLPVFSCLCPQCPSMCTAGRA